MIRRVLCLIAGIDRETLSSCPATDKIWATHLGFSLCLSFVAVLGISFHATGYVIADPWVRFAASMVIALTVFMFDCALYQSDWFSQGFFWLPDNRTGGKPLLWRFGRIAIRLGISFGLAWVIAVFLELAIFSDTIGDKIKRDHIAAIRRSSRKSNVTRPNGPARLRSAATASQRSRRSTGRCLRPRLRAKRLRPCASRNSSSRSEHSMLKSGSCAVNCAKWTRRLRALRRR
jgi:hypothetical protein